MATSSSPPTSSFQWAALRPRFARPSEDAERFRRIFDERRHAMVAGLRRIGLGVAVPPTGAFYVLANCSAFSGADSKALAFDILEHAHVGVDAGGRFLAVAPKDFCVFLRQFSRADRGGPRADRTVFRGGGERLNGGLLQCHAGSPTTGRSFVADLALEPRLLQRGPVLSRLGSSWSSSVMPSELYDLDPGRSGAALIEGRRPGRAGPGACLSPGQDELRAPGEPWLPA